MVQVSKEQGLGVGLVTEAELMAEWLLKLDRRLSVIVTPEGDGIVASSPLARVYWYTDGTTIAMCGSEIAGNESLVQNATTLLSLLHKTEKENWLVQIRRWKNTTTVKMYQRIGMASAPKFSDYLTIPNDGYIFASIGIQRCPWEWNGEEWSEELHQRMWKKLVYVHPEYAKVEHTWTCGQFIIEHAHDE